MPLSSTPSPGTGPGSSRRAATKIYDHIFNQIASGDYAKGDKLPTETELSEEFGVSRAMVREALARLRDDGLVQSRQGSGTFVTAHPDQAVRLFAPLTSIADIQRCYEFRIFVEEAACGLAALRKDEERLAEIHRLLRATEGIDDVVAGVDADLAFHLAIAETSQNRFFVDTLASLRSHMRVGMELTRKLSLARPKDELTLMYTEHQEIFNAIESGNSQKASAAMRHHLESARRRIFES